MAAMKSVTTRVPATTANLGPGYDCLGIALGIANRVTVQRATGDEHPKIVAAFLSVNRGGGPEFFLTPNWMAGLTDPAGRQQATAFKRYRLMFWMFMASAPAWFMLVSRWLWR